jgi:tetratricopeptide (TPR) repeat protein
MSTALERARRYIEIGRPRQALEALGELGSEVADGPDARCLRGHALYLLEDFDGAAEAARDGLAVDPDEIPLLHLLSLAEAELRNLAQAEAAILAALEQLPEDVTLLCQYADVLMRGAQLDKAEAILAHAARSDPEAPDWREGRVTLEYLRGHDVDAELLSRELLAVEPESTLGHRMLGMRELNRGNVAAAQERFSEAVRAQPQVEAHAVEARRARSMAKNPLWWPTLVMVKPAIAPWAWFGGLAILFALLALGADELAGLLVIVCVVLWLWAIIAPAILGGHDA